MLYDPRLAPPATEAEAIARFAETWAAAETAVAARKEIEAFREKWAKLSEGAQATINRAVRAEWGEDLEIGEMLSRATFGWDGYDASELRAEAMRPLIAWWKATQGSATYWTDNTGSSKFVVWVMAVMSGHGQAQHFATPASVRTLLARSGRQVDS
jgi:hypothetical protein